MKRTTVSLPDEMMEKARERAKEGRGDEPDNFSKYIRELVRRDLNGEFSHPVIEKEKEEQAA